MTHGGVARVQLHVVVRELGCVLEHLGLGG